MKEAIENLQKVKNRLTYQILDTILQESERVLNSDISYFATMNPEENVLTMRGWSKTVMGDCSIIAKPIVYKLEETGLWGDAVRERKAVITNDYQNSTKPTKKGYPEGHVHVVRHMNIPVFENNKVVAVLGVGNKASDYTDADANNLIQIGNEAWSIIKSKI